MKRSTSKPASASAVVRPANAAHPAAVGRAVASVADAALSIAALPLSVACDDGDRNFVTALARGMDLLRAFGPDDDYLGNAELARRTGLPRPTVSRLTYTLSRLGYLVYDEPAEKYRLGQTTMSFGHCYVAGARIREVAQPLMQSLAFSTDCSVALASPDRHEMVYLEACQARGALVMHLVPGARLPMATSAMGRAWIASLAPARRAAVLADLERHHGSGWPPLRAHIERALREHARRGFCTSHAEWDKTVSGAAAPIMLAGSDEVLAVNIGGSASRLTPEILETNLGPRVLQLAQALQARLWQRQPNRRESCSSSSARSA